jgi:enoyl-CoA hydratase/carnithine racemase
MRLFGQQLRMPGNIALTRHGEVATITLSNPGKLNAIDLAMWRRLAALAGELDADDSLRAIVVRGEGEAFAAGGDLDEFRTERADAERALAYHETVGRALAALEGCRHPSVAVIRGACVGGGLEIACACDLRIAAESARFGAPINKLGFSMYPGELAGLLRVAGPAVTKEILLEGRLLSAAEAHARGLLTRVVADADLDGEAVATTGRLAAGAPLAARAHKHWIARLLDGRPLSAEEKLGAFAFLTSADYAEGLAAFAEKRRPSFHGR